MKLTNLIAASALLIPSLRASAEFVYGADVSWMTFQEDKGVKFFKADEKTQTTVEDLLQDYGFNAARLRVWVNPEYYASDANWATAGHCSKADVVAKAKRLAAKGQDIMLCFHFSDTWADPAKQRIPKDWEAKAGDLEALTALAVAHVEDVCNALKAEGIEARWVQLGNEDQSGIMTQNSSGNAIDGCLTGVSSSGAKGFISLFNACARAARSIFPGVSIVHHLANGQDYNKVNWNLSKTYPKNGSADNDTALDIDYLGLSLYPLNGSADTTVWPSFAEACLSTMNSVYANYGLKSIVVEVGMNNDYSTATSGGSSQKHHTEQCNKDVAEFAEFFIGSARGLEACDGVFYWEPQSSYCAYSASDGVLGQGGYSMGAMMDIQRNSTSWGSRKNLCPNAYWDMVRQLSGGYEPDLPEPETPGEWNFKYSTDDKLTFKTVPFKLDDESGLYTLSGISDAACEYCLNYFIVNEDESESYIAGEGVKADVSYPLHTTLEGQYEGWTGWLDGKWLERDYVIKFDKDVMTLLIEKGEGEGEGALGSIGADNSAAPVEYFTLQGIRVGEPLKGRMLIRRQGSDVSKIIIR